MKVKFTFTWKPSAELQLAEIWTNADDRAAVSDAANHIDFLLQTDPQSRGESRSGARRILFVPPLAIAYEVHEQDRCVFVLSVRYRKPGGSK